jgi:hypothetical protein
MEPVVVSAAQVRETLRRRRAELHEAMSAVEQALAAPARDGVDAWAERVHVALIELSADLRQHIDVTEGQYGLYRGVLATAPRLANAAAELTDEHAEISQLVDSLLGGVSGPNAPQDMDRIRGLGMELLERLALHRQRGSDLVHEAYEADIGGET